jgi:hypothetical protein
MATIGLLSLIPPVVNRDLDTYPTAAITGFPPGETLGAVNAANAVAERAQSDLTTAYNAAASAPSTSNVTGVDLSGKTLTEGVYTASTGMTLGGTVPLTLDGNADSVWIFQAGSTLTTASNSSVVFAGGARACNVFWQVGSSATLGTDTAFAGNVLALTSITAGGSSGHHGGGAPGGGTSGQGGYGSGSSGPGQGSMPGCSTARMTH